MLTTKKHSQLKKRVGETLPILNERKARLKKKIRALDNIIVDLTIDIDNNGDKYSNHKKDILLTALRNAYAKKTPMLEKYGMIKRRIKLYV